jgi:hypothetical protein
LIFHHSQLNWAFPNQHFKINKTKYFLEQATKKDKQNIMYQIISNFIFARVQKCRFFSVLIMYLLYVLYIVLKMISSHVFT